MAEPDAPEGRPLALTVTALALAWIAASAGGTLARAALGIGDPQPAPKLIVSALALALGVAAAVGLWRRAWWAPRALLAVFALYAAGVAYGAYRAFGPPSARNAGEWLMAAGICAALYLPVIFARKWVEPRPPAGP